MEKNTSDLISVLKQSTTANYDTYIDSNNESILGAYNDFYAYIRNKLKEKGISQKTLFLRADISETYGYKLLSGEKKTKKRDVILRLLIAAKLNIDEVQSALHRYGVNELYAKDKRDALIILCINEKKDNVMQVNELLMEKGFEPLTKAG